MDNGYCFCGKHILPSERCEGGHTKGQRAIHQARQRAQGGGNPLPQSIEAGQTGTEPAGTLLSAALRYAAQGWAVFPCEPRGKKPLTPNGFKDATTDQKTIRASWAKWTDANIGSPMGESRIVIDMDGPEADAPMMELERKHGPLPKTLEANTGRGRHLYFNPNDARIKPSAGVLGPHLDIRGEGSYVILPPSVHGNGTRYQWANEVAVATLPEAWRKLLSSPERPKTDPQTEGKVIPKGQRNSHLTSLAGTMRRRGMGEAAIEAALLTENEERCEPPLPDAEVKSIAQSVGRYEPSKQPNVNRFTLNSLGELMAKPDVPVEYVWEGRLAAGTVSAIVSKPKVGKSTLARGLCLAIARGDDFLSFPTKQGECIYLALEEREEDVRNDFRAMGADGTEPILIHAAAAPAEGIRLLCELVKERRPRLVVIDPLFRLARVRDEKAYAETYNALGPLIDAARESGTHVILLHHSGKGAAKADPIDSPLGSTAIGGAASPLIILKRTETYRVIQTVQRIGQDMPETVLQFDAETKRLLLAGTREEAEIRAKSGEILGLLKEAAEPKTEQEIRESVKGETKILAKALRELHEAGRLTREGEGKRGDPFRYGFSFACSERIGQTSKQETERVAHTSGNSGRNLVRGVEQGSFLVPERGNRDF